MKKRTPYDIVKSRYLTEKARVLETLKDNESNRSVRLCDKPKYVFLVAEKATKPEIAAALEQIYAERKIRVKKVNTIKMDPKARRVRGRLGKRAGYKKAIVTLAPGDQIEETL